MHICVCSLSKWWYFTSFYYIKNVLLFPTTLLYTSTSFSDRLKIKRMVSSQFMSKRRYDASTQDYLKMWQMLTQILILFFFLLNYPLKCVWFYITSYYKNHETQHNYVHFGIKRVKRKQRNVWSFRVLATSNLTTPEILRFYELMITNSPVCGPVVEMLLGDYSTLQQRVDRGEGSYARLHAFYRPVEFKVKYAYCVTISNSRGRHSH